MVVAARNMARDVTDGDVNVNLEAITMRSGWIALFVVLSAAAVLTAPKLVDVWKSPEVTRLDFKGRKVAALVITSSQSLQMSGEEALVRELTARGVNGVATYRIVPGPELKSAETARSWYMRMKVDGVVALRPVRRETVRESSPVAWSSGYYQSFWGYYDYGWNNIAVIRSERDTTMITVETLVYDLTRNQLVWAANSETRDPGTLQEFVKDLVAVVVREMKKQRLVS
jgi:hypothetical protein